MLHHGRYKVGHLSSCAEEHLALAILHILLDIQGDLLCNTEILHILWDLQTHLLRQFEIIIYGMARCKHNCGIIQYTHLLLAEFLRR